MNPIIDDDDIPISNFVNARKRVSKNSLKGKVCLGLCCINNGLRKFKDHNGKKQEIFCSRGTPRSHFTVERAKSLALLNIADISKLVDWNIDNGINHLRLSSDIFPHFTDKETESYTLDFAIPHLQKAGEHCNKVKHRITMHPGQYNQVGAKNPDVFDSTVSDLSMHADILDYMSIDNSGILCVHGGGLYGDKDSAMRRWIDQFDDLPTKVKRRLAIENDEKCYSLRDCLLISEACKIPVIYDTHHHDCYHNHYHKNAPEEEVEDLVEEVVESWRGVDPVFHIAEQDVNKPQIGAHSQFVEVIPQHLLDLPEKYNIKINIEVEAKAKEAAILKLINKYSL
jgi:UV DNA damage endonuclease